MHQWYHSIFSLFIILFIICIIIILIFSFRGIKLLQVLSIKLFILEVSMATFVATPRAGWGPMASIAAKRTTRNIRSPMLSSVRVVAPNIVFRDSVLRDLDLRWLRDRDLRRLPLPTAVPLVEFFVFISGVFCRSGGDGSTKRKWLSGGWLLFKVVFKVSSGGGDCFFEMEVLQREERRDEQNKAGETCTCDVSIQRKQIQRWRLACKKKLARKKELTSAERAPGMALISMSAVEANSWTFILYLMLLFFCYKIYDGKSRELEHYSNNTPRMQQCTITSHVANEDLTHGMKLNACLLNSNVADGVLTTDGEPSLLNACRTLFAFAV